MLKYVAIESIALVCLLLPSLVEAQPRIDEVDIWAISLTSYLTRPATVSSITKYAKSDYKVALGDTLWFVYLDTLREGDVLDGIQSRLSLLPGRAVSAYRGDPRIVCRIVWNDGHVDTLVVSRFSFDWRGVVYKPDFALLWLLAAGLPPAHVEAIAHVVYLARYPE